MLHLFSVNNMFMHMLLHVYIYICITHIHTYIYICIVHTCHKQTRLPCNQPVSPPSRDRVRPLSLAQPAPGTSGGTTALVFHPSLSLSLPPSGASARSCMKNIDECVYIYSMCLWHIYIYIIERERERDVFACVGVSVSILSIYIYMCVCVWQSWWLSTDIPLPLKAKGLPKCCRRKLFCRRSFPAFFQSGGFLGNFYIPIQPIQE